MLNKQIQSPPAAPDSTRAGDLLVQRGPELALIGGRLPRFDVLSMVKRLGELVPPVRRMVLVADAGASEELAALGAELL